MKKGAKWGTQRSSFNQNAEKPEKTRSQNADPVQVSRSRLKVVVKTY